LCEWDSRTCSGAAHTEPLDILQYARAHECPWNASTTLAAVYKGNLEILQWCNDNGCPFPKNVCRIACERGYFDILQYVRRQRWPWDASCLVEAANGGDWRLCNGHEKTAANGMTNSVSLPPELAPLRFSPTSNPLGTTGGIMYVSRRLSLVTLMFCNGMWQTNAVLILENVEKQNWKDA